MAGKAKSRGGAAEALSCDDARAVVLHAQGYSGDGRPTGVDDMLRRVRAVQLDTISVLARTHELTAYSRLGAVKRSTVERAYWGGSPARAFEYWAHALCVLPVEDWPYFAFRRAERAAKLRSGQSRSSKAALDDVRARVKDGPVTATDLGGARSGPGWFEPSEAKAAAEALYWAGEVVCADRRSWRRVYDLPERVLPAEQLQASPSDAECFSHLTGRALAAMGVATKRDIAEYYRIRQADVAAALAASSAVPVDVEGWDEPAWADAGVLARASRGGAGGRTTLVSLFDSLIWERKRMQRLFDVSILLEAYRPSEERKYGYFAMPLLSEGRIVGHVDPARDGKTLVARRLSLYTGDAVPAMAAALREAAGWVGCADVAVERVEPAKMAPAMRRALA